MSLEKALKALMNLGLNSSDAQVYVYLAKKGPREEKALAYALNANDQQIRQSLKNLQQKGFVTTKIEREIVFMAVPLEKVIDHILDTKTEEAKQIEKHKEKLLST